MYVLRNILQDNNGEKPRCEGLGVRSGGGATRQVGTRTTGRQAEGDPARRPHRSTKIPACTACTMLRNLGFSSARRPLARACWVKVEASQSRTSEGTASDRSSCSSSSVSKMCLRPQKGHHRGRTASASTTYTTLGPATRNSQATSVPSPNLPCLSLTVSVYFCFSM